MFGALSPVTTVLAGSPGLLLRAGGVGHHCPNLFFCLLYHSWGHLAELLGALRAVYDISADGLGDVPPQVLALPPKGDGDASTHAHREALQLPYVSCGLHIALLHVGVTGAIRTRQVGALLLRHLRRLHASDTPESSVAAVLSAARGAAAGTPEGLEGPEHVKACQALPAALAEGRCGTRDPLLACLMVFAVVGWLSAVPASLPLVKRLLGEIGGCLRGRLPLQGVLRQGVSLLVTAVGQFVRRSRPSSLAVAAATAECILLPLREVSAAQPKLEAFLYKACDSMHGARGLPKAIADLAERGPD